MRKLVRMRVDVRAGGWPEKQADGRVDGHNYNAAATTAGASVQEWIDG